MRTARLLLLVTLALAPRPAAGDQVYLGEREAPAAVFPGADRFERREVPSTPELRARVAERLGEVKPTVWERSYKITTAFQGDRRLGRAIEVEEIGKHRAITLEVGVDPQETVAGVAVMVYREAYGGEIRSRRFLDQYRGKGANDPLLPSRDILNITGATLSARAVGRAVKKAIAVLSVLGAENPPAGVPLPSEPAPHARTGAGPVAKRIREAHYVMGTILEISLDAPSVGMGRTWIRRAVAEAVRLDRELSSFRRDSALAELNRGAGRGPRPVPPDLFEVVSQSRQLGAETRGTFDVTVSPLLELWRNAAQAGRRPSSKELAVARMRVGQGRITLHPPDRIELAPGTALELGGVGKGFAADRMAQILRRLGVASALVNFGGSSIVALGPPPGDPPWRVWVRHGGALHGPLELRNVALSTSASFGRSDGVDGRRIGHIVDPRTGRGVERWAQATVVAPTATEAEAWSKAMVIDPDLAERVLASRRSLAGLRYDAARIYEDARFAAMTGWKAAGK